MVTGRDNRSSSEKLEEPGPRANESPRRGQPERWLPRDPGPAGVSREFLPPI